MKTPTTKLVLAAVAAAAIGLGATAEEWTTNNVTYTYTVNNGKASIYNDDNVAISTEETAIAIPATLGEEQYPVTSIGNYAFHGCGGLTSITMPDSVTSIGNYAFAQCTDLTSVTIPDSVTSIGNNAFAQCTGLTSVTMTGNAPSVGEDAFAEIGEGAGVRLPRQSGYVVEEVEVEESEPKIEKWQGMTVVWYGPEFTIENGVLTSVDLHEVTDLTIPGNVTSIGESAFHDKIGLTSVTIPGSVTSIGENAFSHSGLTSITIPDSVTSIEKYAFIQCSYLTSVTFLGEVKTIGGWAFEDCSALTSVTMRGYAPSLGSGVFSGVPANAVVHLPRQSGLTKETELEKGAGYDVEIVDEIEKWQGMTVEWYGAEFTLDEADVLTSVDLHETTAFVIPGYVKGIGDGVFENCEALESVTIPGSVKSIGEGTFSECSRLTSVTISDGVTNIAARAFYRCRGLTSVTIPDSVTTIGESAFAYCGGLTSATIGKSVTNIPADVFSGCYQLTSITVAEGNAQYKSIDGMVLSKDGSSLIIGVNGDVTIPDGVKSIGASAFYMYSGLTSVIIGNSVTNIGASAFYYCDYLTSVSIGDGVAYIGASAFQKCDKLTSVTMSGNAPDVGENAFGEISEAAVVRLRRQTSGYGDYDIETWKGIKVEWYGPEIFIDEYGSLTNVVLHEVTDFTVPDVVTSIGDAVFKDCGGLKIVTIPDSVKSIGNAAFFNCNNLTSVAIGDNVTSIGEGAFGFCVALTNVTIPDSVKIIEGGAFFFCSGLTSATIGNSVTNIGTVAFAECSALPNVSIPDSVTSIGNSAFFDCGSLTNATIGNSVANIGDTAFENCTNLTSVTMKGDAPNMGTTVFDNIGEGAVAHLPTTANGYELDENNKWEGMTVEYYDAQGCTFTIDAQGGLSRANLNGATSLLIPDKVKTIGEKVFADNADLASVTFPDSVESISTTAFDGCGKLWAKWFKTLERLSDGEDPSSGGAAAVSEVTMTVTNVVLHYVTNVAPSAAWTPSEDVGIVCVITEVGAGATFAIPADWAGEYDGFKDKFGSDFAAAITKQTGKCDSAGNPMFVWQDYVAGTDPTDKDDKFSATITFDANGKPEIGCDPIFEDGTRVYTIYGKQKLIDEWTEVNGDEADYNFFKVTVKMRQP